MLRLVACVYFSRNSSNWMKLRKGIITKWVKNEVFSIKRWTPPPSNGTASHFKKKLPIKKNSKGPKTMFFGQKTPVFWKKKTTT